MATAKPDRRKEQEEQDASQEGASNPVLGWLGLYLPSYGTSVLLHMAAILLAWLFSRYMTETTPTQPFVYRSEIYKVNKVLTEKRETGKKKDDPRPKGKPGTGRGKFKPNPFSIAPELTSNPFPDVASNRLERLEVFGVGGGGFEMGGFEGLGSGRGFFGAGGEGAGGEGVDEGPRKIVFIVDRSGSMTDSIDYVKYELKRSISELGEEKEFHIIFYSSGPPVEMPTRRLTSATERNKQMAFEFVDSVIAVGETDPSEAIKRAFACQPELIYLLTDGEFDKSMIDLVKRMNVGGKVVVHTIGFIYKDGEVVLKQIADQNGGQYKFVSTSDLANIVNQ